MFLNNQNIMLYGSDEEKSLSVKQIISGTLEFADDATTSHFVDLSNIRFRKMLLASTNGTDITVDGDYFDMTFDVNNIQFTQRLVTEAGTPTSIAQNIRQYAEYLPCNVQGITFTGQVTGIGNPLYFTYNIAFFA